MKSALGGRRLRAIVAAVVVALALPVDATAHGELVRSTPADGAVLANAPADVRFVFDDDVRVASGIQAVRNGGGSVLSGSPRVVRERTLVVPLRQRLGDGDYTVLWRVVSDDGHDLAGVISFAVGAGRAPPVPALSASNGTSAGDVVARWLFLGGILLAAGGALFRVTVGRADARALAIAFVLAFLGGSGLLAQQESLTTRFGIAVSVATLIAALGATAAPVAFVHPRLAPIAWTCALLLLPLPSIAGHALDPGRPRIELVVDLMHLAAAAAWVGGLVQLALALRGGGDGDTLRRFSLLALAAVVALGATGVARAFGELDAIDQIWSTGYGRLLIAKTTLFVALVVVGWINRYRLIPSNRLGPLRRTVGLELILVAGLVVAVAALTDARPGRDRVAAAAAVTVRARPPLPARAPFVDARQLGRRVVALAVGPTRTRVTVLDGDGLGAPGLRVTVDGFPAASCGSGCYEARLGVRPTGGVHVEVNGRGVHFVVPQRLRRAAAIVTRATRAFERLTSVSYVERLASSARNGIVSDFTLEAPNRFSYRVHGGASAIVVGPRRWDSADRTTWDATQQTPLPQPRPIWEGRVTNAYVLSQTPRDVVVTFLIRRGPAWFRLRVDRRTLRPRELTMTAPAHFMHHRYFAFDAPRRIFPPR